MKVYILEAYRCDESQFIFGVFETKEKAEAAAKNYGTSYSIRFTEISEYEVE
jgi:hypothetical protein